MDPRLRLLPLAACLIAASFACHETLPTRIEPPPVFDGSIGMRYEYDRFRNRLRFDLTVKNVFDETLSDTIGAFGGTVTFWLANAPQFRRTIPITTSMIEYSPLVDPVQRTLTMDPGDSLFMQVTWDLMADDSVNLRDTALAWHLDPSCAYRLVADRAVAVAELDLMVFAPLQNVRIRGYIPFCFYNTWVETAICPLPNVLLNGCASEN